MIMFEGVDDQGHADRLAAYVRGLTACRVDGLTGLDARGDDGWEDVVTAVQRDVADALEEGRFTDEPHPDDVAHEIADGLVPVYNAARVREFAIVGAAWSSDAPAEMGVTGDMIEMIGVALYDVYRSAVGALLDDAADNVPADPCADGHRPDDDPEPGDRCKDCGEAITWDGPGPYDWSLADDPDDEYDHSRAKEDARNA